MGVDVATSGRSVLNIRKDWLDMYGLEEPKTLDDIEHIAQVFLEKQPSGEGTIPIAAGGSAYNNFLAGGAAGPGFEPVFAAYDAYPGLLACGRGRQRCLWHADRRQPQGARTSG